MEADPLAFGWDQGFAAITVVLTAANVGILGYAALLAKDTVAKVRRERFANRQAEVAERMLSLIYEAPVVFGFIRSPGGYISADDLGAEDSQKKFDRYVARINTKSEYFEKVGETLASAEVYTSDLAVDCLKNILELRAELYWAAEDLWSEWKSEDREERNEARRKLYFRSKSDAVAERIDSLKKTGKSELLWLIDPTIEQEKK